MTKKSTKILLLFISFPSFFHRVLCIAFFIARPAKGEPPPKPASTSPVFISRPCLGRVPPKTGPSTKKPQKLAEQPRTWNGFFSLLAFFPLLALLSLFIARFFHFHCAFFLAFFIARFFHRFFSLLVFFLACSRRAPPLFIHRSPEASVCSPCLGWAPPQKKHIRPKRDT